MARFLFAETWTGPEAYSFSAAPLASLPVITNLVRHQSVTNDDYISLTVPLGAIGADALDHGRVIKLTYDDGSVSEWRISEDTVGVDDSGETLTIRADTLLLDLGDEHLIAPFDAAGARIWDEAFIGLTPEEYITMLLDRMHTRGSYVKVTPGAFSSSARIDLSWRDATVLSVARMAAADPAVNGELEWLRDGAAGYTLGIVDAIGVDAEIVEVLAGKNLRSYRRSRSSVDFASVIVGRGIVDSSGKPASVAHTVFRVAAVAGDTITIEDPINPDVPLLTYDATAISARLVRPDDPSLYATVGAQNGAQLTLSPDATGFTVGSLFEIRSYDGNEISELTNFTSVAAPPVGYGRKVAIFDAPDARGERNYLLNPFFREWPTPASAGPVGWTYTGPYGSRVADADAPAGVAAVLRSQYGFSIGAPYPAGTDTMGADTTASADYRARLIVGDVLTGYRADGTSFGDVTVTAVSGSGFTFTPPLAASTTVGGFVLANTLGYMERPTAAVNVAPLYAQSFTVPPGISVVSLAAELFSVSLTDTTFGKVVRLRYRINAGAWTELLPPVAMEWVTLSILGIAVEPGDVVEMEVYTNAATNIASAPNRIRWAYVGAGSEVPPAILGTDFRIPEFSNANLLWRAVARQLSIRSIPRAAYDLSVVDLTRVAGGALRDVLAVGQTLLVESPAAGQGATPPTDLDVETLRITSLTVDELDPAGTTLTVDPVGERALTGFLTRGAL